MTLSPAGPTHLVVLTTAPSAASAKRLVQALVERRLVACGTVLPDAVSLYWWKGAIEESSEALVLLKTTRERYEALAAALPALHPYDVPELIALPVAAGLAPYLAWVSAETVEPDVVED